MVKFETRAIRLQSDRSQNREHSVPLYATSSFVFENAEQMRALFAEEEPGHIYSRFSNPSVREFEEKMAALESLEDAHATGSGMAGIFASLAGLLESGDHVVASRALFGASHGILNQILPGFGISHTAIDSSASREVWEAAVTPKTKMIFVETPSNPGLAVIDLEMISAIAKSNNLILNVDNCFATPYLQNPANFGADLVTHSATKFIDGQGRVVGGVVAGQKDLVDQVRRFCRKTGPALSPFNAWILSKSLETLAIRMDRHCSNALALAHALAGHPAVDQVNYPHLETHPQFGIAKRQMRQGGGIVTFEVKGGLAAGTAFLDRLKMISLTANLGDSRTIATHPGSSTHSKLSEDERRAVGITPGLVRISVGLEHIDDILEDVIQGLG